MFHLLKVFLYLIYLQFEGVFQIAVCYSSHIVNLLITNRLYYLQLHVLVCIVSAHIALLSQLKMKDTLSIFLVYTGQ